MVFRKFFTGARGEIKMESLVNLAQDIPWIMAPASLIAALSLISIIAAASRLMQNGSKIMMLGVVIAVTAGVMLMQAVH